jgi:signal transduction histidine kinase
MGLRTRVLVIVGLPAAVLLAGHGLLRLDQERSQLEAEDQRHVELTAKALQIAAENALRDGGIPEARRLLLDLLARHEGIDRVRMFGGDLRPVILSSNADIDPRVPERVVRSVIDTGASYAFYDRVGGQLVYYYVVPLHDSDGSVTGSLELLRIASRLDRRLGEAFTDVIVRLGLLLAALTVLITLVLQRHVIRPIAALVAGLQRLGRGETDTRLPVTRRDQLGVAAAAFNDTARQLGTARAGLIAESARALDLERQVQRAARLAVAGKLASGLAHEVGTPLNIISGHAEMALKEVPAGTPLSKDLEVIIAQIDRIKGIINSLLDTVRPQAPVPCPCDIESVVHAVLPLFRHAARARGVTLSSTIATGLPKVICDVGQLQQVVINLITNALDATPGRGRVVIEATPQAASRGPGVCITVTDTGHGIPAKTLPRVFEPFFTTKPRGEGTGLGLAISRDIVVAQGGDIRIVSEEGRGTTVVIWLPEAAGDSESRAAA